MVRIYQLCSRDDDKEQEIVLFVQCLPDRGINWILYYLVILQKAIDNEINISPRVMNTAAKWRWRNERLTAAPSFYTFHLTLSKLYKSRGMAWYRFRATREDASESINSKLDPRIAIDRLIDCYHRSGNLGNLISYRKIDKRHPKVSSDTDTYDMIRHYQAPLHYLLTILIIFSIEAKILPSPLRREQFTRVRCMDRPYSTNCSYLILMANIL